MDMHGNKQIVEAEQHVMPVLFDGGNSGMPRLAILPHCPHWLNQVVTHELFSNRDMTTQSMPLVLDPQV